MAYVVLVIVVIADNLAYIALTVDVLAVVVLAVVVLPDVFNLVLAVLSCYYSFSYSNCSCRYRFCYHCCCCCWDIYGINLSL